MKPGSVLKLFKGSLEGSPLRLRLASGAFWSLAGTLTARTLALGVSVFVARILGRTAYGEFGTFQATVGMFASFAAFGLGLTATKYVGELRLRDPVRAGRIIGLSIRVAWASGTTMTVVLFFIAPWLASHALSAPQLTEILRIGSLLLLVGAIDGAQSGALAGFEAFRRLALVNFITGALSLPLVVGGAWFLGLKGAVLGLLTSQTLNCLLSHRALRAEAMALGVRTHWSKEHEGLRVLWDFSVPALVSGLLVAPVYWACTAMLVNQPDGYAQMGLFTAANQWFGALLFLPNVLGQAALPVFSERSRDLDRPTLRRLVRLYIGLNVVVVLPLILLGIAASRYIMQLYGAGFREGWLTLSAVLITAGFVALQTPVGHLIVALDRMWLGTAMNLGWAVSFVVMAWLFVPFGALGLAGARLAAYALHAIWTSAFALSFLRR
jgi:O-antigen/teichoic acid export membrane protein